MSDQSMRIIGVAGTNGSGKDVIMELLAKNQGYLFVSATDLLAAELTNRGLPLDREHKSALSAEWRREFGMGVIVQKAYGAWQDQKQQYPGGVVVGSLRHPGEADVIHELGGVMLWVDADPQVRYERIQRASRGRGVEDEVSFKEFIAQEEREMHPVGDAATLHGAAVKERSDVFVTNEGTVEELHEQIEGLLRRGGVLAAESSSTA